MAGCSLQAPPVYKAADDEEEVVVVVEDEALRPPLLPLLSSEPPSESLLPPSPPEFPLPAAPVSDAVSDTAAVGVAIITPEQVDDPSAHASAGPSPGWNGGVLLEVVVATVDVVVSVGAATSAVEGRLLLLLLLPPC